MLLFRNDIPKPEQLPFALFVSVASLWLVVVLTEIGLRAKSMNPAIAQALMGAALLSLLVFPTLSRVLSSRTPRRTPRADSV